MKVRSAVVYDLVNGDGNDVGKVYVKDLKPYAPSLNEPTDCPDEGVVGQPVERSESDPEGRRRRQRGEDVGERRKPRAKDIVTSSVRSFISSMFVSGTFDLTFVLFYLYFAWNMARPSSEIREMRHRGVFGPRRVEQSNTRRGSREHRRTKAGWEESKPDVQIV